MKFESNNILRLGRELSDLDLFAIGFMDILKKYTSYAVVSGYVSILLGRSRVSEDIDVIVPKLSIEKFRNLLENLNKSGFYCLNAENPDGIYEYLTDNPGVRFAKLNTVIPNIELKFAKNKIDDISLSKTIRVRINNHEIVISHLEMQIAFKENVLKSSKDIEDARHLRNISKGHVDENLIKKYKVMLDELYK